MNNDLQKAVITALTVISVSVGYYFLWHLPRQEKAETVGQVKKEELTNQQKCQQVASAKYEKESKEVEGTGAGMINPEYKYNSDDGSCLYLGGMIFSVGQTERFIIDVYTNKTIAEYLVSDKGDVLSGDKFNFDYTEDLLFRK